MTRASGVEGGAPWDVRWSTRWRRATLGHKRGSLDALCTISPPPDAVLLGCEHRGDKVGSLEVAFRGCGHKEATASSEGSIFKAERGYL